MANYASITWALIINQINNYDTATNGLKNEQVKYEFINSTTGELYGSGKFSTIQMVDTITFSLDEKLELNVENHFIWYLWIDGKLRLNPNDIQNQTYDFDINCNITGVDEL